MFDPNIGRFLSMDPIGLRGRDVNLYRYVGNNPVNYTDPSGLKQELSCSTISIGPFTHGGFSWKINWELKELSAAGGQIIQRIKWRFKVQNCDCPPKDIDAKCDQFSKKEYWEAWPVGMAENLKQQLEKIVPDRWGCGRQGPGSQGTIEITATAWFYEGLTEKDLTDRGFKKPNKETAADENQYATGTEPNPKLPDPSTGPVEHSLVVKWKSCADPPEMKTTLTPKGCGK